MFIDQAKISIQAGKGGDGCVSFRREKFVPKGGPDGGDGGNGGNIICKVDDQLQTLLDFRYRRHFKAKNGKHGQGANKTGKKGEDLIIKVPKGTLIRNLDTGAVIGDLVVPDKEVVIAKGGKGGRGNARFTSPTNQAPRKFEPGKDGEALNIQLELKLIADIGLVGLPNAGKSTLLSSISAAHPKVADYPFTTLTPNLGIVKYKDQYSYIVADIPGLIEGAHTGKGLGIQFLRHIERTRVLAFLIDSNSDDIKNVITILRKELQEYNPLLLKKPWFVVLTKIDLLSYDEKASLDNMFKDEVDWCAISSITGEGIEKVKTVFWNYLSSTV